MSSQPEFPEEKQSKGRLTVCGLVHQSEKAWWWEQLWLWHQEQLAHIMVGQEAGNQQEVAPEMKPPFPAPLSEGSARSKLEPLAED